MAVKVAINGFGRIGRLVFRAIAEQISIDKIHEAVMMIHSSLVKTGLASPRIAVAALNPHAGEGGLLGTEEITVIQPAIEKARNSGMDVSGPWPADTLFVSAKQGRFDGVVTMYHDQGQIALKLLGFDRGVTVLGGLPYIIATPAHGTAFDIAGTGTADPGAMMRAMVAGGPMVFPDMQGRRADIQGRRARLFQGQ